MKKLLICKKCGHRFEHIIEHRDHSKRKKFCDECLREKGRLANKTRRVIDKWSDKIL